MVRLIGTLLLGAALAAPVAIMADDHPHRYYDKDHKDYHEWNDHEDRAYRYYLNDQHKEYRDWTHVNHADQQRYWNWRHDHPDAVLKLDIH